MTGWPFAPRYIRQAVERKAFRFRRPPRVRVVTIVRLSRCPWRHRPVSSKHERIRERAPIKSPILLTTEANGLGKPRALYSGQSLLSSAELMTEEQIMSVANAQPHRRGVANHPDHAWKASALGRFVRMHWHSADGQREHWLVGERYAQLIDAERLARGLKPRQCGESLDPVVLTLEERQRLRVATRSALKDANDAIREIGPSSIAIRAIAAIRRLAWEDRDTGPYSDCLVVHGLYKLRVHFERLDQAARRRRRA